MFCGLQSLQCVQSYQSLQYAPGGSLHHLLHVRKLSLPLLGRVGWASLHCVGRSLSVSVGPVAKSAGKMCGHVWQILARVCNVCSIHTYSHLFYPFIAEGDPTGISEVHHAGNCCMSSLEREHMNVLHCFTNFRIMKCSVQLSVKSSRLSTAQIALSEWQCILSACDTNCASVLVILWGYFIARTCRKPGWQMRRFLKLSLNIG